MELNELQLQAKDLNQQGVLLLKATNVEAAKQKFDEAINIEPMCADSYQNYGDLYMFTKEFELAKKSYKKALLIEKKPILYFLIGNAHFMLDEMEEGLNSYNIAVSAGYDNDQMLFFLGTAYEQKKDYEMALRYYQKASVKNPVNSNYKIQTIKLLMRLKSYELASKFIDNLITTSPELFEGYHFKNLLLIAVNKFSEAKDFSKRAFEKFPSDIKLLLDYVSSCILDDDLEKAVELLSVAKQSKLFEKEKPNFLLLEGKLLFKKQEMDLAIIALNECASFEHSLAREEAQFILMNIYLIQLKFDKVLEVAEEIIAKPKLNDEPNSMYLNAAIYYKALSNKKLGDEELATQYYKEAISKFRVETLKYPKAIDAYMYRAMCLKDTQEYDKALDMLNLITNIIGENAEVLMLKAQVYDSMSKTTLAKETYKKAYELKPELENLSQGGN